MRRNSIFGTATDRQSAVAIAGLAYCNPFLPERVALEKAALGAAARPTAAVLSATGVTEPVSPNVPRLAARCRDLVEAARLRLRSGASAGGEELEIYDGLVFYLLYDRFHNELLVASTKGDGGVLRTPFFRAYLDEATRLRDAGNVAPWSLAEAAHYFACFFQIRRAFHLIYEAIVGASRPAAELRAAVWQSIFTADARRYRSWFYRRAADVTTLVVGPSGTGKELVARAIAGARYVPFDPARSAFVEGWGGAFFGLNLSALSPTLVESELFGHRRGAFTGAVEERPGFLEVCGELGTVFLDEIGDLDPGIQVKLLRVLQTRTFQKIGDTRALRFDGKIVAATNRDLARDIADGRFREDFYYRLCADQVRTRSLAEQLASAPADLPVLVAFLVRRVVGSDVEPKEVEGLASEVVTFIERRLSRSYDWPGNVRELEQCVRNVLIRGEYSPAQRPSTGSTWCQDAVDQRLTADQLLSRYATFVYARCGSYQEAGRRLGLDRRTLKSKIDQRLLGDPPNVVTAPASARSSPGRRRG